MQSLVSASDLTACGWVTAGLRGFGESVVSVVPTGFAAYVRVFHPAYVEGAESTRPVRWAEIAAAKQKTPHPGMQFDLLVDSADPYNFAPVPGVFDRPPQVGSPPPEVIEALVPSLAAFTTTPQLCWFAVWEGWGDIRRDVASAPKFEAPGRAYHLLSGPIEAAAERVCKFSYQSASIWWPDDHAWCVASEIDFDTTYIGCSATCAEAICHLGDLEVAAVDPTARGYAAW